MYCFHMNETLCIPAHSNVQLQILLVFGLRLFHCMLTVFAQAQNEDTCAQSFRMVIYFRSPPCTVQLERKQRCHSSSSLSAAVPLGISTYFYVELRTLDVVFSRLTFKWAPHFSTSPEIWLERTLFLVYLQFRNKSGS